MDLFTKKRPQLEYMTLPFEVKSLEVKADGDKKTAEFVGYAAVTGNVDQGRDLIESGAFAATIAKGTAWPIQNDHKWDIANNAGFNRIGKEDDNGLLVNGVLNLDKQAGKDAYSTMQQAKEYGAKVGLSIGYMIPKGGAEYDDAMDVRKLKQVDVFEYSVTLFPMNTLAGVTSVKSVIDTDDEKQISEKKREIERILRDAGCTKAQALKGVAAIFERDAEDSQELTEEINNMIKRLFQ